MKKERNFSVHSDFKTGIFCKLAFITGAVLVIIYIFLKISSIIFSADSTGFTQQIYNFSITNAPESILAFAIIIFAVGVILYFFNYQFAKLEKIADEIEKGENLEDFE